MIIQQGDVLLKRISTDIDKEIAQAESTNFKAGRWILAEGEATGHAHAIQSPHAKLVHKAGLIYLLAYKCCQLQHEEHGDIAVLPGTYELGQIREINPMDKHVHAVAD